MEHAQNSYGKGLDRDTSYEKRDPNSYYDALNIRVVTDAGLSTGSIENEQGNRLSFRIPGTQRVKRYTSDGSGNLVTGISGDITDLDRFEIRGPTALQIEVDISSADTLEEIYDIVTSDPDIQQDIDNGGYRIFLNNNGTELLIVGVGSLIYSELFYNDGTGTLAEEPIPEADGHKIVGWGTIREKLVVFTTNSDSEDPASEDLYPSVNDRKGTLGQIWVVEFDEATGEIKGLDSTGYLSQSEHMIFNGVMDLSLYHEIAEEVVGRYETGDIQRIYWTDDHNPLRSVNIMTEDLLRYALDPSPVFNIRPSASMSQPEIRDIGAGNVPEGSIVQITYRLRTESDVLTGIAPLSRPVKLTDDDPNNTSYRDYMGTSGGDSNSRSVTFEIPFVDENYSVIELIAVVHDSNSPNDTPQILRFSEENIGDGISPVTRTFTNNESNILDITLEEFNRINKPFNSCKTISSKDNRLIAANTSSRELIGERFDARAYRFDSSQEAVLRDRSGNNEYTINGTSPNYTQIDDDADAINPYNKEDKTSIWENDLQYKYQANGLTLGGSGPNISYEFTAQEYTTDNAGDDVYFKETDRYSGASFIDLGHKDPLGDTIEHQIGRSFRDPRSPFIDSVLKGYRSGEVYRFGIVFYDKEGYPEPVQWIGDIKFPKTNEDPTLSTLVNFGSSGYTSDHKNRSLGIRFTVDTSAIRDRISGFEIVRLERRPEDMTRPMSGFMSATGEMHTPSQGNFKTLFPLMERGPGSSDEAGVLPARYNSGEGTNGRDKFMFHSPDVQDEDSPFRSNGGHLSGDYLEIMGHLWFNDGSGNTRYSDSPHSVASISKFQLSEHYSVSSRFINDIDDLWLIDAGKAQSDVGSSSLPFYNYIWLYSAVDNIDPGPEDLFYQDAPHSITSGQVLAGSNGTHNSGRNEDRPAGIHTRSCVVSMDPNGPMSPLYPGDKGTIQEGYAWPYVDYCRIVEDQYGGDDFDSRSGNEYISTGHYQAVTELTGTQFTMDVFGGDINSMVYSEQTSARMSIDSDGDSNEDLVSPKPDNQILKGGFDSDHVFLDAAVTYPVETSVNIGLRAGTRHNKDGRTNNPYLEDHLYHGVYDRPNDVREQFFTKDDQVNIVNERSHRIWVSDQKFDGENVDSWSVFKPDNYNEVHGVHGPINRLAHWKDRIYFFQTSAMGIQPINERAMSKDQQGNDIVLGDGSLIGQYKYISTDVGTFHQHSVVGGKNGLYLFDSNNMKVYRFNGESNTPLSDINGMSAYFARYMNSKARDTDRIIRSHYVGELTPDATVVEGSPDRLGVHGVYDDRFNRVIFTFLTGEYIRERDDAFPGDAEKLSWEDQSFTISVNEQLQAFESFYTFKPSLYIDTWRRVLSVDPKDGEHSGEVYVHNDTDSRGVFYGELTTSEVEHVITDNPYVTKIFDNIELHSEISDGSSADVYLPEEHLDRIQAYNHYQFSGVRDLIDRSNIRQRHRKWRVHIPRAVLDQNGEELSIRNTRMRSPWLHVRLYFDNDGNKHLVMRDVTTSYRVSRH